MNSKALFVGAVGLFVVIFGLWVFAGSKAGWAQSKKPTPEQQSQCIPAYFIKSDAVIERLFPDADGDWWITIRYRSTGIMNVGLLLRNGLFCAVGEGKTNRET